MNKTLKKVIIWTGALIVIGVAGYIGFVAYVVYSYTSGCGTHDGPFNAVLTNGIVVPDSAQRIDLTDKGQLVVINRTDTLSPLLALVEQGKVKWALDMDVRNTKGYESYRIWELSKVKVTKNSDPIKLTFLGHWTYGAEGGWMEIDRKNGDNCFCLSW